MASDSKIQVKISAETSGFEQITEASDTSAEAINVLREAMEAGSEGLDQAAEAASKFGTKLADSSESINVFGDALKAMGTIAAGVFGGLSLESLAGKLKSEFEDATIGTWDWAESLKNLSISTGLTTDQLQALQYAGEVTGVNMGRLQMVVNMVSRAMTEFADGSKRAVEAAGTLGLDPSKWASAYDALTQIGEKYKELTEGGKQLSLANEAAFQVFLGGRFGMQSLAALERLPELEKQASDAGVITGADMIKSSDEAAEAINKLGARWDAFIHRLGGGMAESLLKATELPPGFEARMGMNEPRFDAGAARGMGGGDFEAQAESLQPMIATQKDLEQTQKELARSAEETKQAESEMARMIAQDAREMASETDAAFQRIIAWHKEEAAESKKSAKEDQEAWDQLGKQTLDTIKRKWQELQSAADQAKEHLKADSEEIASVLQPVAQAFEQSFTGVIQGTQNVTQAFKKMADSIALELLKSGLHDLLMGGAKNTLGASIFGVSGEGGGIAGALAKAFQGSAVATALKTDLSQAWSGLTGPITTVFGAAWRGIQGIINSIFGTALGSGGGAAAGGVVNSAMQTAETALSGALLGSVPPESALAAAMLAWIPAASALTTALYVEAMTSGGFLFMERGGVVPSAAGGMVAAGGLALLHPREMVLPANISDMVQRMADGESGGNAGPIINVSFNISALDGNSAHRVIMANSDSIAQAVAKSVRGGMVMGTNSYKRTAARGLRR